MSIIQKIIENIKESVWYDYEDIRLRDLANDYYELSHH